MSYRRFIYSCILFSFCNYCSNAQGGIFSLKGIVKDQPAGKVVLSYAGKDRAWVNDTCILQKGKFHFTGYIDEPTIAHLRGDVRSDRDNDPNAVGFYVDPASMDITVAHDHFKQIKITGSKTQREYEEVRASMDSISDKSDSYYDKLMNVAARFIASHPSSYVSAFELLIFMQQLPLDTVNTLYHRLDPAVQRSQYGKAIYPRLVQMLGSLPGRMAAEFTINDMNGQTLRLSSLKGQYVLLDFWASWCLPCRTGAPLLRAQYAKYHDMGLAIIGIADDDQRPDLWKAAIVKDSTGSWYNVLRGLKKDEKGNDDRTSSINDLYGIGVLPSKILIGKDGVIIGRYEGEEQDAVLYKKLAEIFSP